MDYKALYHPWYYQDITLEYPWHHAPLMVNGLQATWGHCWQMAHFQVQQTVTF